MEQSLHAYFYFLILFLTLTLIVGAVAFLSFRTGRRKDRRVDADGYAGGFYLLSSARRRFPARQILAVLTFVPAQVAFLLTAAWALNAEAAGADGFFAAGAFVLQTGIGFWFAVKKGLFEWK